MISYVLVRQELARFCFWHVKKLFGSKKKLIIHLFCVFCQLKWYRAIRTVQTSNSTSRSPWTTSLNQRCVFVDRTTRTQRIRCPMRSSHVESSKWTWSWRRARRRASHHHLQHQQRRTMRRQQNRQSPPPRPRVPEVVVATTLPTWHRRWRARRVRRWTVILHWFRTRSVMWASSSYVYLCFCICCFLWFLLLLFLYFCIGCSFEYVVCVLEEQKS